MSSSVCAADSLPRRLLDVTARQKLGRSDQWRFEMAAGSSPSPDDPRRGATRRAVLAGTVAGAAGLAVGAGASPAVGATATRSGLAAGGRAAASLTSGDPFPARPRDFVKVRGGKFSVDGKPLRVGGTNTYYLHQQSHYMIDSALDDAAAMSLSVVRAWAFADGSGNSYTPLQSAPYVYNTAAFDSLDYAIYKDGQP